MFRFGKGNNKRVLNIKNGAQLRLSSSGLISQ